MGKSKKHKFTVTGQFGRSVSLAAAAVLCAVTQPIVAQQATRASGFDLDAIYNHIGEADYEIKWQPHVATLQAPNRANNLRFTLWSNGFTAERRVQEAETDFWRVTFVLESYGRSDSLTVGAGATSRGMSRR